MREIKVTDRDEHLYYLRMLRKHYTYFQPEMRRAIDYAIKVISKKGKKKDRGEPFVLIRYQNFQKRFGADYMLKVYLGDTYNVEEVRSDDSRFTAITFEVKSIGWDKKRK